MLRNYFKTVVRNLKRNKVFSFINISGLSMGLMCCMLILLYIKDEISYDRFHSKKDDLFQLVCDRVEKDGLDTRSALAAMVQGPAFKQAVPEIKAFTRVNHKQLIVKRNGVLFNEDICWVDENFFSVFSFPLLSGNAGKVLTGFNSMVVSEATAKKYFGTTDVVGKTLDLQVNGGFESFSVSGIAKNAPPNSSIKFNILLPFNYLEKSNPDNGWMWFSFPTFFILNPHANLKTVAAKMEKVYQLQAKSEIDINHEAGYDTKFIWGLLPLTKMHLNTEYQGNPEASDPIYMYILGSISIFILAIACINFINLSIAQSLKRSKEIGIRKTVGGTRAQLICQFLGESMFVCLIAFLLAILTTLVVLPVFNEMAGKKLGVSYLLDIQLIAAAVVLFVLTVLMAGFYPAVILSHLKPVESLGNKIKMGGKNYLSKALVIAQFSLATLLIIATLFVDAQFAFLTNSGPGYNNKNLIEFVAGKAIMDKPLMDVCKSAFAHVAGVEMVGYTNVGKFGGKTQAGGKEFAATYLHVDEHYLTALQAGVLSGRNFSTTYAADIDNAVLVNETFANQAGWQNAVGKTVDFMNLPNWGTKKITVIGVVKDYHFESLREKIKPEVFTMDARLPLGKFMVRIRPANTARSIKELEKTYHKFFPDEPFQYSFTDDLLQKNYELESRWRQIITYAALVTIFISCIGLFGLALLTTERRFKEISIRKIMGASISELVKIIILDFVKLVCIAFCIAIPAGWYAVGKWLQNFAYRIPLNWWLFALAGSIALVIALFTVGFHAIRAAVANPVESLKNQ